MHFTAYVLIPLEKATTSAEARHQASAYLVDNEFVGGEGRWGSGISDWFVIGGRWSGSMTMARLDKKKLKRFWTRFEKQKLGWSGKGIDDNERKNKISALFLKYFPDFDVQKTPCPPTRSPYSDSGYEDDAVIVDDLIWDEIIIPGLKKSLLEGGAIIHVDGCEESESDLDKEKIVGQCWCVVIDFHC
ncbi:MAG: hypothetical protein JW893_02665 [Candidatus Omnitrophica bacterium]|nr:hypothetical protein [Candidatus Omnitrophota bacterium]